MKEFINKISAFIGWVGLTLFILSIILSKFNLAEADLNTAFMGIVSLSLLTVFKD